MVGHWELGQGWLKASGLHYGKGEVWVRIAYRALACSLAAVRGEKNGFRDRKQDELEAGKGWNELVCVMHV